MLALVTMYAHPIHWVSVLFVCKHFSGYPAVYKLITRSELLMIVTASCLAGNSLIV